VSEEKRSRNIRVSVRFSEEEHKLLKEKMSLVNVTNQEAYIRKMVLDGIVVKLDMPEIKQMLSLLRYTSNNINQIAKHLNESGRFYKSDIVDVKEKQTQIWELASDILLKLSDIK
jgi:hypothetical protein